MEDARDTPPSYKHIQSKTIRPSTATACSMTSIYDVIRDVMHTMEQKGTEVCSPTFEEWIGGPPRSVDGLALYHNRWPPLYELIRLLLMLV
jgi:hypothetical protein